VLVRITGGCNIYPAAKALWQAEIGLLKTLQRESDTHRPAGRICLLHVHSTKMFDAVMDYDLESVGIKTKFETIISGVVYF